MNTVYRTQFDVDEIPSDLREFFEEVQVTCGTPWRRVVERNNPRLSEEYESRQHTPKMSKPIAGRNDYGGKTGLSKPGWRELPPAESVTTGWEPGCTCDADVIPCTVLDPFGGAGTVGLVSDELGRNAILVELNAEYAQMAKERIVGASPMFADVVLEAA